MSDIFFSHVEEDRSLVTELATGLEQAGYTTWYHERDSLPGVPYVRQIPGVIDDAQAVVVVLSARALASPHVAGEVHEAYRNAKPFIPLLIDLSHSDFRRQRRDWALMLGAAVFVTMPATGIASTVPRITEGLRQMNVRPSGSNAVEPAHPAAATQATPKVRQPAPSTGPVSAAIPRPAPQTGNSGQPGDIAAKTNARNVPPVAPAPSRNTPVVSTAIPQSQHRFPVEAVSQTPPHRSSRRGFMVGCLSIALVGGGGFTYWNSRGKDPGGVVGNSALALKEVATFMHEGPVFALSIHPKLPLIASGGGDGKIRLWDLDRPDADSTVIVDDNRIRSAAISPDGATLATGSYDTMSVRFWSVDSHQSAGPELPHGDEVYSVAYHPDGSWFASGCKDEIARIWNVDQLSANPIPINHGATVLVVAFHPQKPLLATGSRAVSGIGKVRLWDLTRLEAAPVIHDHGSDVLSLAFSPDGSMLASGSADRTVQLWKLDQPDNVRILNHDETVRGLAFHPDGSILAAGSSDGQLRLWNLNSTDNTPAAQVKAHTERIRVAAFRPDGSRRLLTAGDDDAVRVWTF